jgi:hypothetical protein
MRHRYIDLVEIIRVTGGRKTQEEFNKKDTQLKFATTAFKKDKPPSFHQLLCMQNVNLQLSSKPNLNVVSVNIISKYTRQCRANLFYALNCKENGKESGQI